jgi:glutamate-ammonia-ligase adenylyltransferase
LKQGVGGIADIEFIVQFGVLANAGHHSSVTQWTDVVRQLGDLSEVGFLSSGEADALRQAYCHYRTQVHHCALREVPAVVPSDENLERSERIQRIWQRIMQA